MAYCPLQALAPRRAETGDQSPASRRGSAEEDPGQRTKGELFLKVVSGRQRGRRRKNKTPVDGSHSTSDRVNICSSTVSLALRASSVWPPGFTLASALDLRPKAASV